MRMIYSLLDAGAAEIIACEPDKSVTRSRELSVAEGRDVEDGVWMKNTAKGDCLDFQRLLLRYKGLICSTVYKVLQDSAETEDIFQEVSTRIWLCSGQYHADKGRVITWVVTMARNCAIDRLRAKQRRTRWVNNYRDDRSMVPECVEHQEHGYDLAERREKCRAVRDEVNKLSKDQREAIELAFFKGMTQNEIAIHLGSPVGTIKARIRRGMIKLREPMMELC